LFLIFFSHSFIFFRKIFRVFVLDQVKKKSDFLFLFKSIFSFIEPTTDSFIAIMYNDHAGTIPGNALVVDPTKPFRPLSKFGNAFLNRFVCSQLRNEVLETVTFIDTPGILAGEKQRVDRGYEFTQVLEWFADRCDRILLLFDVSSLDISDELKRAIEVLRRNDDKIRIVLNKADSVDHQALMRVYGALMWSLGKVLGTPEVCRVYVGSFWSKPLTFDSNRRLFELETKDLFDDLGKKKLQKGSVKQFSTGSFFLTKRKTQETFVYRKRLMGLL